MNLAPFTLCKSVRSESYHSHQIITSQLSDHQSSAHHQLSAHHHSYQLIITVISSSSQLWAHHITVVRSSQWSADHHSYQLIITVISSSSQLSAHHIAVVRSSQWSADHHSYQIIIAAIRLSSQLSHHPHSHCHQTRCPSSTEDMAVINRFHADNTQQVAAPVVAVVTLVASGLHYLCYPCMQLLLLGVY